MVYFRNPMGVHERTSVKEHLVRHGSKHKIQVHTTKRNGNKNENKIVSISKTRNNEKPEKDH